MLRFVRSGFRRALLIAGTLILATTGVVAVVNVAQAGSGPSSGPPTVGSYGIGPSDIDHFGCYLAVNTAPASITAPKLFTIPPAVNLVNQFTSAAGFTTSVGRLIYHCNPTQKTTSSGTVTPIINPMTHMACFLLPVSTPATSAAGTIQPPHTVTITNQFGTGTLTTGQPRLLCLPTWKNLTTATALSEPPGLDHYVCYAVTNNANMPKPAGVFGFQDQFNTALSPPSTTTTTLGLPNLLCVPTLKSPNPLFGAQPSQLYHPNSHLVCYPTFRPANVAPAPGGFVTDENQFGIGTVETKTLAEVCVPSFKTVTGPQNSIVITKYGVDPTTGASVPLTGATFVATPSVAGNPSGTCTMTGGSNTCTINGLAQDTYTVTETVAPAGWAGVGTSQTVVFTTSPQILPLTFTDTPIQQTATDTIAITKVTNPNSAGGGTPLAGATFTAVGALPTSPVKTCTTDATGTCQITGLPIDTYTVSETTPPPGYSPALPQTVTFTTAPQTLGLTFFDNPAPQGPTDSILVKKVGTTASGKVVNLAGATFTATPSIASNPSNSCVTTAPAGTCTITGLAIDTYTVAETTPPPGWAGGPAETVTFSFAPQTLPVLFKDTPAVGTPGG